MPRILRLVCLCASAAMWLVSASQLSAAVSAGASFERLQPVRSKVAHHALEAALLADAADGRLDQHSLVEAALVASGVRDKLTLERYLNQFAQCCDELREHAPSLAPRERASVILAFLHRRLLTGGYRADCTDLAQALDEGEFNCVSSVVLFNALCEQAGLTAQAVAGSGHVFSVLVVEGERLDVETTCPDWFRLQDQEGSQHPANAATPNFADQRQTGPRRELDALGLLALIYYNRGVELLERKEFSAAIAANRQALLLDPRNVTAEGNLLAAYNNWALHLSASENFEQAIQVLDTALQLAPGHDLFRTNYVAIRQQWVAHLASQGRVMTDRALPRQ